MNFVQSKCSAHYTKEPAALWMHKSQLPPTPRPNLRLLAQVQSCPPICVLEDLLRF